jgi:hypothetical protein
MSQFDGSATSEASNFAFHPLASNPSIARGWHPPLAGKIFQSTSIDRLRRGSSESS